MTTAQKPTRQELIQAKSKALEALAWLGQWKTRNEEVLNAAIWATYNFAVVAGKFLVKKPPTPHATYQDHDLLKLVIATKERTLYAMYIGVWLDDVNLDDPATDLTPLVEARMAALQFVRLGKELFSLWHLHLENTEEADVAFADIQQAIANGEATDWLVRHFRHSYPLDQRYYLLLKANLKATQRERVRDVITSAVETALENQQWARAWHKLSRLKLAFPNNSHQLLEDQWKEGVRLCGSNPYTIFTGGFVSITPVQIDRYTPEVVMLQNGIVLKRTVPGAKTFFFHLGKPLWITVQYTPTQVGLPHISVPLSELKPDLHATTKMAYEQVWDFVSTIETFLKQGSIADADAVFKKLGDFYPGNKYMDTVANTIGYSVPTFDKIANAVKEHDFATAQALVAEMEERLPKTDFTRMKKLIAQGMTAKRQLDRAVERAMPFVRQNRICHKLTALAYRALERGNYREAEFALNLITKINPVFYSIETLATKMAQAIEADALAGAILAAAKMNQVAAANLALHDFEQKFPNDPRVGEMWKMMYRIMSKNNQSNRIEMILMHRLNRAKKINNLAEVGKNLKKMETFNPQSSLLVALVGEVRAHIMDIVEEAITIYKDGTGFLSITPVIVKGYLPATVHAFQNDIPLKPTWSRDNMTNFRVNPTITVAILIDYSSEIGLPFFTHCISIQAQSTTQNGTETTTDEAVAASA